MRALALLALLVAPCGAFFHGAAPGWGLAPRSLSSHLRAQQPFCARQLVVAGQDGGSVGGWGGGQARVVTGRWGAESCITLRMEGRVGVGGGRWSAGRGRGRGGADDDPSVGQRDGGATRPSGGMGGSWGFVSVDYERGRGERVPAKRGGGLDAAAVRRGDGAPTRPSGEQGGYRGGGIPAKRGGGAQLTGEIKECRELGELARILQEQSGMLNRIHVSAAWVCLARIGRGGGAESTVVLTSLQDQTREVLDQMGAREIANMMYSIGRISQIGIKPDRELLEAIQTRATATVGEFIPQHVANVMWALATMGEKADRGLLTAMQTRATATAVEFAPQAVSNLVWALATMGEKADRGLLEAMQSRATATAGEFKPQEGTNLLWALAKMGERADLWLLEAMQRRATATAGEFVPQDVANLLWALATMRERADRGLLMAMVVRATARAENFKPQEVSNLLWSLAAMGEKADRGLLDAMQTRATSTVERFKPQEVANLLWALATMGEKVDPGLLEAMQRRATSIAGGFKPQEVTNMLWALAVMGGGLDGSLAVLVDCLAPRILELRDQFTQAENSQLHQWLLSCELGLASGASLPEGVARVKLEIGEECLQAFSGQATHESRLQRDVATALKRCAGLEVEIEEEFHDARSGYSIDVLVRRRSAAGSTGGAKALEEPAAGWAVEVDGPSHFLVDGRTPNGSTILKRRQLEQLGYTVVPVPFLEWQALRGEEAQKGYLEDKLRRASMVD